MKRRGFFGKLSEWAAGLMLGGAAAAVPATARENLESVVPTELPAGASRRVHWVSPDRRHIEARLVRNGNGYADLEVEMRPPIRLANGETMVSSRQLLMGVRLDEGKDAPWKANSWHYPEQYEVRPAKPYSEWWYRRSPDDDQAVSPRPAGWALKPYDGQETAIIAGPPSMGLIATHDSGPYRKQAIAGLQAEIARARTHDYAVDLEREKTADLEARRRQDIQHLEYQISRLQAGECR